MKQTRFFLLALCVFSLLISCEKEEDNPDYVGTWAVIESVIEDGVTFQLKDIMTFKKSSFTNIGQLKNPTTNKWIDLIGVKGSISVDVNTMNVTITEVGMSTIDLLTGIPTGEIVYYGATSTEFTSLLEEADIPSAFKAEYSISGNEMTLKTDLNNDGDYLDEDETVVYTKQ